MKTEIDLTPSPRLLQVLGDIPLQPWQCLSELIDNSLDDMSRSVSANPVVRLRVDVRVRIGSRGERILVVADNGSGMSDDGLELALRAGATTKARYGTLGLFGMGFNIATARLGMSTAVLTATATDAVARRAVLDFGAMQRAESFRVPVERVEKPEPGWHGTIVEITLKRELAEWFGVTKNLQTIRNQLGDVYSYLLRASIPGMSPREEGGAFARVGGAQVPAEIYVQDQLVEPRLPCVWSDKRSVASYGQEVPAIIYIDTRLTEASACLVCGHWDRTNGPSECAECGSDRLEMRGRRIWGWIGIQRYIDSAQYGIDFLRYGRKILKLDKSLFAFQDPDTLQAVVEYPIEMPANQGRIVGEIHLDHVPVTYQKNDFDRQHRDWAKAVEVIRGTEPLKPKSSTVANASPLARLFSAFRRNDPGLRYLTAGDGSRAIHAKSKEWASYFDKGVPQFQDDSAWFEAAQRHDSTARSRDTDGVRDGESAVVRPPTHAESTSAVSNTFGRTRADSDNAASVTPPRRALSRDDSLADARRSGSQRVDLSGEFTLRNDLGTWKVQVIESRQPLVTVGGLSTPVTQGTFQRGSIEVFVNPDHPVVKDFGQGLRELSLLQVAEVVHELTSRSTPISVIFSDLISQVEDLRTNAASLQGRVDSFLERLRTRMHRPVSENPASYWDCLTAGDKTKIEETAAVHRSAAPFGEIVDSGEFVLFASAFALSKMVAHSPVSFFEGTVFKPALRQRPEIARAKIVGKITRSIEGIGLFIDDPLMRMPEDLRLAAVHLEILESQFRSEEYGDS
jgi:hypothetical protein